MTSTAQLQPIGTARRLARTIVFRGGVHHYSAAQFLVALVLLIVSAPFVQKIEFGDHIESALFTLVMLSAVLAIGAGRSTLVVAILLVIPAVTGRWATHLFPEQVPECAGLVPALMFIAFVVFHLLRFILRAPRVNSEVLCAGVATYVMLGLFWAFAYVLVAREIPNAFAFTAAATTGQSMQGFNSLYFSLITLGTVGYGDIVPVSPTARMLAMTEGMTGTLYLAVLISRLVALHSAARFERDVKTEEDKES